MEPLILTMSILAVVAGVVSAICAILVLRRSRSVAPKDDQAVVDALAQEVRELADRMAQDTQQQLRANNEAVMQTLALQSRNLETQLATNERGAERYRQEAQTRTAEMAKTLQEGARAERQEMTATMEAMRQAMDNSAKQSLEMTSSRMDALRQEVAANLTELRQENNRQLEEMRGIVNKQLHDNLEMSLSRSFALITDKLQQVYQGLGEMQTLAGGVSDLKRVLTGVKTRGIWGELSLRTLLEEILTSEQYVCDFHPAGDRDAVEFAIRLPGQGGGQVYLPIDSKFPMEDYERLVDAAQRGDKETETKSLAALEARIKSEAKDIATKYIRPPVTTDFAVLYLPIEGLFAEVTRRVGLIETLRRQYKVIVAGPTTLTALLNSLQVGFRTLAIEQRSQELWQLLESFRAAFDKFSADLAKAEKQVQTVANTLHETGRRTARINEKLRRVQTLAPAATEETAADVVDDEGTEDDTDDTDGEN